MLNKEADKPTSKMTSNSAPLPRCFCNWKHCRTWQKEFATTGHPHFSGVIKLKFYTDSTKSMALKSAVERCLRVDASRRNEWKVVDGRELARFYVAKHHYTPQILEAYNKDRKTWDWSEPLDAMDAKQLLHERSDAYYSDDEESVDSDMARYVQTPNVPKDKVREALSLWHEKLDQMEEGKDAGDNEDHNVGHDVGHDAEQDAEQNEDAQDQDQDQDLDLANEDAQQQQDHSDPQADVKPPASSRAGNGESQHTQSTLATTVTDLHAMENLSISGPSPTGSNSRNHNNSHLTTINGPAPPVAPTRSADGGNAQSEENVLLREQLSAYQDQLSQLQNLVQTLTSQIGPGMAGAAGPGAPPPPALQQQQPPPSQDTAPSSRRKNKKANRDDKSSGREESEDENWNEQGARPGGKRGGATNRPANGPADDDDIAQMPTYNRTARHGPRYTARKSSVRSKRSIRRDSMHSRRNSIHSRRSMRGGGGGGDDASVMSRQSLHSVSPSIKSLPREIELMDDDEDEEGSESMRRRGAGSTGRRGGRNRGGATPGAGDDDYNEDQYRRPEDDTRSVGSRSAASRRSRQSFVGRNRARGSRVGGANNNAGAANNNNSNSNRGAQSSSSSRGSGRGGVSVPVEIDVSGDELEDETYANVSNDTLYVKKRDIVDPYGEQGVYTGALSRSTGMPNGRGRLEYERAGRWYEGDWCHGRWTGYGRLSNGDGDFYEGGLRNDHKHGRGKMHFADGRLFEGEYVRGQMVQGQMTYQDGSVYNGSWVDGMRHGTGQCVFVDGSEYQGEFKEGSFHGQGRMTWNDGGWYIGQWWDGEMNGRGREIRPDGSLRHDGEWSRGQPIRNKTSR